MARPWQRLYWLDSVPIAGGKDELPFVWATSSMRYPLRDRDYRLSFDPELGQWAVYIRMTGFVGDDSAE